MKWLTLASAAGMLALLQPSAPPATSSSGTPKAVTNALARLHEEARIGRDGSLAITNGRYHARFSKHDGLVFTPRIDGKYDTRLTWQYRVRSLETDTSHTPLAEVEPAVSRTGDHVVDFVRPGIIERYEGERTGVEQIFVLTERPHGRGNVRIRGDVTFAGESRAAGEGLEFAAGDAVPLAYSTPVAFDAKQRPLPVRVQLHDGTLDLVLDAATLEGAEFPVTIDPLLGATTTYALTDTDGLGHYIDVAYNWDRGEFLVVFDTFSPPDLPERQVRAKRFYDHGDAIAGSYLIGDGSLDINPNVAYDLHTNTYLVVWHDDMLWTVRGRRLASDGSFLGAPFHVGEGSAPEVAARNFREHTSSEMSFLVVWVDSGAIRRARFDAAGQSLGQAQVNVTALDGSTIPAVAYDPSADRFLVAWQSGAVRARAVSAGGAHSAEILVTSTYPATGVNARAAVAFDPSSKKYFLVAAGGGSYRGFFLSSATTPVVLGEVATGAAVNTERPEHAVTAWPGGFVLTIKADYGDETQVRNIRFRGDGTVLQNTQIDHGHIGRVDAAYGQHGYLFHGHSAWSNDLESYIIRVANGYRWTARYVHANGDFDGDGRGDLFLYRPEPSSFRVRTLNSVSITSPFAAVGGIPALLDWDGDGKTDLSVWSAQNGAWRIRASATNTIETPALGRGGDIPVPGDYLGLGRDQIAVFRPSIATWYIDSPRTPTSVAVQFGELGDLPVPADWNGDGDIELGVWRPSTGMWYAAEVDGSPVPIAFPQYGQLGDMPFAGQFVGGATADQVLYRRSNGTFYTRNGATGFSTSVVHFYGLPVPLDWNGDGRLDHVVVDPDAGTWYIFAPNGNTAITDWGETGDIPAGGR